MRNWINQYCMRVLLPCLITGIVGIILLTLSLILRPVWKTYQIKRFVAQLEAEDFDITESEVAASLARFGPDAVPSLAELLRDREKEWGPRMWAAYTLGSIGPQAKDAVPVLVNIVTDQADDETVRAYAAEALGQIGVTNRAIISALNAASHEESEVLQASAQIALLTLRRAPSGIRDGGVKTPHGGNGDDGGNGDASN